MGWPNHRHHRFQDLATIPPPSINTRMLRASLVFALLVTVLSSTTAGAQPQGARDKAAAQSPQKTAAQENASATQQKSLGTFGDWAAVVDGDGNKRLCYIGSAPKKAEGKYTTRGEAHFLVTHRPADKVKGEISVSAGYPFKEGRGRRGGNRRQEVQAVHPWRERMGLRRSGRQGDGRGDESRQAADRSRHVEPRHGDHGYLLARGFHRRARRHR